MTTRRQRRIQQPVPPSKMPGTEVEVTPGEHLWVVLAGWRVNPATFRPDQPVHLDTENLVHISSPGCYVCEEPWSWAVASKPCPGEPIMNPADRS